MCIMDSRDQVFRCKTMRPIKVIWRHRGVEEATWEREDTMRTTYPFLFENEGTLLRHVIIKGICVHVGISGRNYFKRERM